MLVPVAVDGREPWLRELADGDDDSVEHRVQDLGVEPDGVHEPEHVTEVPDVPQDLAVAQVAPGVTAASGGEGEVGEAAGEVEAEGHVDAAVDAGDRRSSGRTATVRRRRRSGP